MLTEQQRQNLKDLIRERKTPYRALISNHGGNKNLIGKLRAELAAEEGFDLTSAIRPKPAIRAETLLALHDARTGTIGELAASHGFSESAWRARVTKAKEEIEAKKRAASQHGVYCPVITRAWAPGFLSRPEQAHE